MKQLFQKEEDVMDAIWDIGHPCVISEILMTHPELKRNTVAKLLVTLEKKGFLEVDSIVQTKTRTGRAYKPTITKAAYEEQKQLFDTVINEDNARKGVFSFISALVESQNIDDDFIQEMDSLINNYKEKIRK